MRIAVHLDAVWSNRPETLRLSPVSGASALQLGLAAALVLLSAACRAPQMAGFDVASPEWRLQQGQAVWQPPAPAPAIAGDVVLGTHPDGHRFIDFSKGSLPIVVVRYSPGAWQLEIPAEGQSFGRRGSPPPRSAWLVLARHLAGAPLPRGWNLVQGMTGTVRLWQPRAGEQLELYLDPACD
jgi:hypothetical protein